MENGKRDRGRQMESIERKGEREKETERERQTDRQTEKDRQSKRDTNRDTDREKDRQRQTDRQTEIMNLLVCYECNGIIRPVGNNLCQKIFHHSSHIVFICEEERK